VAGAGIKKLPLIKLQGFQCTWFLSPCPLVRGSVLQLEVYLAMINGVSLCVAFRQMKRPSLDGLVMHSHQVGADWFLNLCGAIFNSRDRC
jgi:hypothetical protein